MYPYDDTEAESGADKRHHALQRLVEDPLYWREQDPEFRAYIDNGFKSIYGNDEAERDATGRTLDPAPKPVTLPPFKPSITADDVNLAGGVGDNQPNRWRDVYKVQKGLANTGHYALDLTQEKSGEHSPTLAQAIRDFQREKREEIDGTLLPGGPTIKRLGESLFGVSSLPRLNPKSAPPSGVGELDDANGGLLHLVSQKPRPPGTDRADSIARGVRWVIDQIRKLPQSPSPRTPKRIPEDVGEEPQGKRAVIVTMPNRDAYILLEPAPRDKRSPGRSDFVRSDGAKDTSTKAHHFDYRDQLSRRAYGHALPMYAEEADEVRQRIANGEQFDVYTRWMAEKPMYRSMDIRRPGEVDSRQPLFIRYYFEDGTFERRHAQRGRTKLWVSGNQRVEISAHDAVKLGLIDWMPYKPPRTNFPEIFERESLKRFFPVPDGAEGLSR